MKFYKKIRWKTVLQMIVSCGGVNGLIALLSGETFSETLFIMGVSAAVASGLSAIAIFKIWIEQKDTD